MTRQGRKVAAITGSFSSADAKLDAIHRAAGADLSRHLVAAQREMTFSEIGADDGL